MNPITDPTKPFNLDEADRWARVRGTDIGGLRREYELRGQLPGTLPEHARTLAAKRKKLDEQVAALDKEESAFLEVVATFNQLLRERDNQRKLVQELVTRFATCEYDHQIPHPEWITEQHTLLKELQAKLEAYGKEHGVDPKLIELSK